MISLPLILNHVQTWTNVPAADIRGQRRYHTIIIARHLFAYLARKHTRYSFRQIGAYVGLRDHTTVLHACRATERRLLNGAEGMALMLIVDRIETGIGVRRNGVPRMEMTWMAA